MTNNPIEIAMEKANLSVERIASILEVTRQTINNYMKNPGQIPAEKIFKLSSATGIAVDKLYGSAQIQKGPIVVSTYGEEFKNLNTLINTARDTSKSLSSIKIDRNLEICREEREKAVFELNDIINVASIKGRKPTICAFGPSDAGKSTLINYLLGEEIVPVGYSPMTTVPTYIKHESEKPDFLEDPVDNTIVYGRKKGEGGKKISHSAIEGEHAEDYIIRRGNYKSLLKEFGTREGEYYKNSNWEIDEIDVYANVDLLKEVTFIDIPGFDSGDDDDNIGLAMDASTFDVIFFLSTADAYLRGHELAALCYILRMREDLSSLYLLATHTNSIGDPDEVKKIIYRGCERIVSTMSEDEKERLGVREGEGGFKALEKRCFGFDMSSEKYCNELNSSIEKELPRIITNRLNEASDEARKACQEYKKRYQALIDNVKKERRSFKSQEDIEEEKKKNEKAAEKAIEDLKEAKERLKESISEKEGYSLSKMKTEYSEVLNEEFIVKTIDTKRLRNKKADIEDLSNYLSGELNDRLQRILSTRSKDFANELEKELNEYQHNIESNIKKMKLNADFSGFDFTRAFAAGLTGLSTYGALAVWASIVAGGSNLGAYILVAKVVSVLSALGISVGGTAAAVSFVSAIGGPVTIGITLAIIAAIAAFGIFTGTWKNRVASKMVKTYRENRVLDKCCNTIKTYWRDTENALDNCMDSLSRQVRKHYEEESSKEEMANDDYIKMTTVLQIIYSKCVDGYSSMIEALCE